MYKSAFGELLEKNSSSTSGRLIGHYSELWRRNGSTLQNDEYTFAEKRICH